jgi:hypothetical protein
MTAARLATAGAACALALFAARAPAASALDFDVWMRAIDARSVAVQKRIAAGDTAGASDDARELERLYALTEDWFARDGGAADAVAVARDGKAMAAAIPAALAASDPERAAFSARAIAKACNDCHDSYKPFK